MPDHYFTHFELKREALKQLLKQKKYPDLRLSYPSDRYDSKFWPEYSHPGTIKKTVVQPITRDEFLQRQKEYFIDMGGYIPYDSAYRDYNYPWRRELPDNFYLTKDWNLEDDEEKK